MTTLDEIGTPRPEVQSFKTRIRNESPIETEEVNVTVQRPLVLGTTTVKVPFTRVRPVVTLVNEQEPTIPLVIGSPVPEIEKDLVVPLVVGGIKEGITLVTSEGVCKTKGVLPLLPKKGSSSAIETK